MPVRLLLKNTYVSAGFGHKHALAIFILLKNFQQSVLLSKLITRLRRRFSIGKNGVQIAQSSICCVLKKNTSSAFAFVYSVDLLRSQGVPMRRVDVLGV